MSCRVRLQYANIRYLFMFRFAHSLTRSLAPTHCPIPFFIYPLRMHDFSILHCCTKVGIAIYPPWRIHIQKWFRYSLILISCACSVRGIYLRASEPHHENSASKCTLSFSPSTTQNYMDSVPSLFVRCDPNAMGSLPSQRPRLRPKMNKRKKKKQKLVTNKRKHIRQSLLHFIFRCARCTAGMCACE